MRASDWNKRCHLSSVRARAYPRPSKKQMRGERTQEAAPGGAVHKGSGRQKGEPPELCVLRKRLLSASGALEMIDHLYA